MSPSAAPCLRTAPGRPGRGRASAGAGACRALSRQHRVRMDERMADLLAERPTSLARRLAPSLPGERTCRRRSFSEIDLTILRQLPHAASVQTNTVTVAPLASGLADPRTSPVHQRRGLRAIPGHV